MELARLRSVGGSGFSVGILSDVCCVAYISRSSLQFETTRTREVTFSELIVLVMQNLLGTVLSWNPAGVGVEDRRDGGSSTQVSNICFGLVWCFCHGRT